MDICETLVAMREKLTPDGAWCQNASWRDADGNVPVRTDEAVSWCLYGAAAALGFREDNGKDGIHKFLNARLGGGPISYIMWNDADDRTQAEVLAFLDDCIDELVEKDLRIHLANEKDIREHMIPKCRELEDA